MRLALRLVVTFEDTATVFTGTDAAFFPAAMRMLVGRVADELPLASFTVTPPFGAGIVSPIVPVVEVPPVTVDKLNAIDATEIGLTVRVACTEFEDIVA